MQQSTMTPRPPFDFFPAAAVFASGDPAIRIFYSGIFLQVPAAGDMPAPESVRSLRSVDALELTVAIHSVQPGSAQEKRRLTRTIMRVFSTADDPAPFDSSMQEDPVLSDLTHQIHGLRIPAPPTVIEARVDSVIGQQISLCGSPQHREPAYPGHREGTAPQREQVLRVPRPGLAGITGSTFLSCGLTIRKGEYSPICPKRLILAILTRMRSGMSRNGTYHR
jgi:hypothetical protein